MLPAITLSASFERNQPVPPYHIVREIVATVHMCTPCAQGLHSRHRGEYIGNAHSTYQEEWHQNVHGVVSFVYNQNVLNKVFSICTVGPGMETSMEHTPCSQIVTNMDPPTTSRMSPAL